MEIIVYENSLRAQSLVEILKASDLVLGYNKILVLPIPSSRDGAYITGTDVPLSSLTEEVSLGDLVICYGLSEERRDELIARGCEVFDVGRDEEFLRENARLTAEATIGILLENGKRSLADLTVGIVGYGRIGESLAEMLLYFGSEVIIYTTREEVQVELSSLGIRALLYDGGIPTELDYLVNTAPSDAFWCASGDELTRAGVPVIELASGDNFGCGVELKKYPSLPGRVFPVSSGKAWARAVERFLSRENRKIRGDAI